MTYVITSACIDVKDQSCIEVCPVDCIYVEPDDRMCFIHPEQCINCAVCVEACPVAAIYLDKELSTDERAFIGINEKWFVDRDAVRAEIARLKE